MCDIKLRKKTAYLYLYILYINIRSKSDYIIRKDFIAYAQKM